MEENINLENEISLLEIWNKIWKNKFLILIITLSLTFVSFFGLHLYNNNNATEEINFKYSFTNANINRFPNQEIFDYRMINTLEFLNNIKSKDDDFKNINVESLISNDKVVIEEINNKDKDGNIVNTHFKITIPTKVFGKNKYLARNFARAINQEIIELANLKTRDFVNNYINDNNNNSLTDSLTYVEVINVIRRQYNELINKYDSFISNYNDPVLDGGTIVSDIREQVNRWYNTEVYINELENEIIQKGYVWNKEKTKLKLSSIEYIDKKIANNKKLLDEYETRLSNILENSQGVIGTGPILDEIVRIIKENHMLELEKEYYEMVEENLNLHSKFETSESFDINVKNILNFLNDKVVELNNLTKNYNEKNNRVVLIDTYEFKSNKPFNMNLILVVLLIISGSVAVTTAFIKESFTKEKKLINK